MKVEAGKKVKMEYELRVDGGDLIESSASRGPIEYVHGRGTLPPAIEKEIDGLAVGEDKEGVVKAAFGTEDTLPTTELSRKEFPKDDSIEEGKVFEGKDPTTGNPVKFTVTEVGEDTVKVRFDHPLVGKDIRYKVKILEVSDPN